MRFRLMAAVGMAALALGLAACGDSGDGGGGGNGDDGAKLSQAELNTKSGAICADGNTQIEKVPVPDLTDAANATTYLTEVVRIADDQIAKLRALEPADDLKANYDAYLAVLQSNRDKVNAILDKAKAQDPTGLQDLEKLVETDELSTSAKAAASKAGLTECAKGDEQADTGGGKITVEYEEPQNDTEALAKEILSVGGTDGIAQGFTSSFKLPTDVTIKVERGEEGPYYDPNDKSIHYSYGFVDAEAKMLQEAGVVENDEDLGKQLASINSFFLVHEMGHAFVDLFEIPITGREEDAVDGMATVFFTDAVEGGEEYAFYAARFMGILQDVQGEPNLEQFQDEHSLSVQRAYDILCGIAGSSEEAFNNVAALEVLNERRLSRCPQEYEQKSKAWKTLLEPHLKN